MSQFANDMQKLRRELVRRVRKIPRKIGGPLVRDLARKTPNRGLGFVTRRDGSMFYSGRAAANWVVNAESNDWIVPHSPDATTNAELTYEIAKAKLITIGRSDDIGFRISNPVFYISYLNKGWSKKARKRYLNFIVEAHIRRANRYIDKWVNPLIRELEDDDG